MEAWQLTPWHELDLVLRLIMSSGIGALIGYERERAEKPAGFRTLLLVWPWSHPVHYRLWAWLRSTKRPIKSCCWHSNRHRLLGSRHHYPWRAYSRTNHCCCYLDGGSHRPCPRSRALPGSMGSYRHSVLCTTFPRTPTS